MARLFTGLTHPTADDVREARRYKNVLLKTVLASAMISLPCPKHAVSKLSAEMRRRRCKPRACSSFIKACSSLNRLMQLSAATECAFAARAARFAQRNDRERDHLQFPKQRVAILDAVIDPRLIRRSRCVPGRSCETLSASAASIDAAIPLR
jgi:hypothetical protein